MFVWVLHKYTKVIILYCISFLISKHTLYSFMYSLICYNLIQNLFFRLLENFYESQNGNKTFPLPSPIFITFIFSIHTYLSVKMNFLEVKFHCLHLDGTDIWFQNMIKFIMVCAKYLYHQRCTHKILFF